VEEIEPHADDFLLHAQEARESATGPQSVLGKKQIERLATDLLDVGRPTKHVERHPAAAPIGVASAHRLKFGHHRAALPAAFLKAQAQAKLPPYAETSGGGIRVK
jgi:hypothetical protein